MNDIIKRPAPALALGETLLKMLADKDIPAEKMKILLDMQREIMLENRREQFYDAFAQMAPKLPQIDKMAPVELVKDGKRLGGYKYAPLEDIDEIVRPIMHEFGFSVTFTSRIDDKGRTIMVGTLMHAAGHSVISERPITPDPGPGRNAAQAEGSGTSYARRYVLEGLLNIVRRGVDDDAIATGFAPLDDSQVKDLTKLIKETKTDIPYFLSIMVTGVEKLEDVPAREYPRLKNALQQRLESMVKREKK